MFSSHVWQQIFSWASTIADIAVLWFLIFYTLKIVRNNTRTVQIFKGIILILAVKFIASVLALKSVASLADMFLSWGFIAIIIIFQPEIRILLERLGKSNLLTRISTLSGNEKEHLVNEIVKAIMLLSQQQTGALVSIEQSQSLEDYIQTGTKINSDVTAEMLTSIFVTTTPLHDGAVIIRGDKIACASAYFPPTTLDVPNRYGARHRAAIGISEVSDCVTIVVSEEIGTISVTEQGKIMHFTPKELREYLLKVLCYEEIVVSDKKDNDSVKIVNNEDFEVKDDKKVKITNNKLEKKGIRTLFALKNQNNKNKKDQNEEFAELELDNSNIKLPNKNKDKNKIYGKIGDDFVEIKKAKNIDETLNVDLEKRDIETKAVDELINDDQVVDEKEVLVNIDDSFNDFNDENKVYDFESLLNSNKEISFDDMPFEFNTTMMENNDENPFGNDVFEKDGGESNEEK